MTAAEALPDDTDMLKAMLLAERAESERLRQIIKELQRHRFGRRAESLPEEQLQLGLEEAEQAEAAGQAESEENTPAERKTRAARRRANRGALPAHLPRIDTLVDVASMICPGCSGPLHRIGEDVAGRLDIVPAQFRVLVVRRPKYACRSCEDVVVQAAAPASFSKTAASKSTTTWWNALSDRWPSIARTHYSLVRTAAPSTGR